MRSRGGLTTKVHALTEGSGRVLVVLLTAGNVHDTTMFAPLLGTLRVARTRTGRPRTPPGVRDRRQGLQLAGQPAAAARARHRPHHSGEGRPRRAPPAPGSAGGRPPGFDPTRYARRDGIERGFCQLKHWRGLATRYDKHARNYAGAITLAALLTWLP